MSENTLPLVTEAQIETGAELLDELIDFKVVFESKPVVGATVETFDGKAFEWSLKGINSIVSPYIPDEYKANFQTALDDVLDGDKDYTTAAEQFFAVAALLVEKIDTEKAWIKSAANVLIETLNMFVNILLEKETEE